MKIIIYIHLNSTTLSRTFTKHISHKSFIVQHQKNIHAQRHIYEEYLPKRKQYYNIKKTKPRKTYRFSRYYILETYKQPNEF